MTGAKQSANLLRSLSPELIEGVFVFITLAEGDLPRVVQPRMMFQEREGTTYIVLQSDAVAHYLPFECPCRMITLKMHSALDAGGFIAHITTLLARCGMSVNPIPAFFHDHLFVPNGREAEALTILNKIAEDATC